MFIIWQQNLQLNIESIVKVYSARMQSIKLFSKALSSVHMHPVLYTSPVS